MTEPQKTYYEVLGIPSTADAKTIRQAYLRSSLKFHPDKNTGNEEFAKSKFIQIGEAYEVLRDPTKRASYDRELAAGKGAQFNYARRQHRATNATNTTKNTDTDAAEADKEYANFMNMFDETVGSMSEQELNMAMGAAAVVGSVIGSILGARAGKGNSVLSSAASMMGSAMASKAAASMVKNVHEDSRQRVLERDERNAAMARGEAVPEPKVDSRERIIQDAMGTVRKMAEAAMNGGCGGASSGGQYRKNNTNATMDTSFGGSNNGGGRMSWGQAAKLATMAAGAVAEMQRQQQKSSSSSGGSRRT